jgi:hypothetical protein
VRIPAIKDLEHLDQVVIRDKVADPRMVPRAGHLHPVAVIKDKVPDRVHIKDQDPDIQAHPQLLEVPAPDPVLPIMVQPVRVQDPVLVIMVQALPEVQLQDLVLVIMVQVAPEGLGHDRVMVHVLATQVLEVQVVPEGAQVMVLVPAALVALVVALDMAHDLVDPAVQVAPVPLQYPSLKVKAR